MYLYSHEIADSRDHALDNLLALSTACLDAGQRLSGLLASAGRETIRHWPQFDHGQPIAIAHPAATWLDHTARVSRLVDATLVILGDAQKAMIRSAEAQVRAFDRVVFSSLNRATRSGPWESAVALSAMKVTLESAEQTLHGISTTAIETVDLAEQEIHQAAESLAEPLPKPAPRKRPAARTKAA